MKLLLASSNESKLKAFKKLLLKSNIDVLSMADFKLNSPEESADSFQGNALIKAQYSSEQTGLITLADDSGLSIVALDNAPGIYSARWANGNYEIAFKKIQTLLGNHIANNSKASFTCVLCLYFPNGKYEFFTGKCTGNINFPPRGSNGFGYDSIFIPQGLDKTFAEMTAEEKAQYSHRHIALSKLQSYLHKYF